MISALMNHLWQSTLFVLAAAITAAALRKNRAHIRHGVWVIASLKFLVPFSLLISAGSALTVFTPPAAITAETTTAVTPSLPLTVDRFAQPFTSDDFVSTTTMRATASTTNWMPMVLLAIWAAGLLAVASMRLRGWRRIRALVRQSAPIALQCSIPVRSSPGLIEPGVVGIRRPVLLVPTGIEKHLTPSQLDAVFAHELCHVQRRDNLTAAIHMVVEAVFWFYPPVWWIGARMVEERERACDEYVVGAFGEPQNYAESILNVCKLYVESPLPCVSGVNGSDLKKRVAAIMSSRIGARLNFARKAALTLAAILAIALPLVAGMLTAPFRAPAPGPATATTEQSPPAKFDLVSIRACSGPTQSGSAVPSTPGLRSGATPSAAQTSPGYVYWDCVTLAKLVDQAYADSDHPLLNSTVHPQPDPITRVSRQPKRVRGGPSWVETDMFTIEAKASVDVTDAGLVGRPNRNLTTLPGAMSQALRAMLEDRFQLKVRRVQEQQDLYALKIAKGGLNKQKVTKPTAGDCITIEEYSALAQQGQAPYMPKICGRLLSAHEGLIFSSVTMHWLAEVLSSSLDRFVVDQTGVDGLFNFALLYPEDGPRGDEFFIRALEQLGLKLEATKGPAEYLLIESVQRPKPNSPDADALQPPPHAQGPGRKPR
jgi:uncharacterized protein (TIGR03435 family)